ncbi:MAG TPA: EboA domain-containing protein, partial [Polyangiales bacterium]|nr:EboA domain-containing protein [Polyangiales bacterium]
MTACVNPESLRQLIERAVPDAAFRAFCEQLERLAPDFELPAFLGAFTATARTLGRKPLGASADEVCLTGTAGNLPLVGTTTDVAGRMLLLYALAQAAPQQLPAAVKAAYEEGDSHEKLAVMRALPLLPEAERFIEIALDIGRVNELDLFCSLAARNPYPSRYYNELAWNKLYMKAVFIDAPLSQMLGVEARNNAELSRMALEYVEQQESAGRRFPSEIWQVIAAHPPHGAVGKLLGYLSHAVPDLRLGAAAGLERVGQARTLSFLQERANV